MKAHAIDWPFGIRVNTVASSNVNTPMIRNPATRRVWSGDPGGEQLTVIGF